MQIINAIKQFQQQAPKVFIGIIVVIVLFLGSIFYVGLTREDSAITSDTPSEAIIEAYIAGEIPMVCDYVLDNGNIGRGYFRTDRTYSLEQFTSIGTYRLIKLEDHGYIWRTNQEEGFKVDSDSWNNQYDAQVPVLNTKTMKASQAGTSSVECQEGDGFEEELFTPPSDISFSNPFQEIEILKEK